MSKKKYPFKPTFDRVLLQRENAETRSKGGIILKPAVEKRDAPSIGLILDVGPTCDPTITKLIGKRVMFARFAGDWITIPDVKEEYYICSDQDIIGEILA